MGAGASIPETLDKEQAKTLAGDKWDEAAFDAAAKDGKITAEQFNAAVSAAAAPTEAAPAEAAPAEGAPAEAAPTEAAPTEAAPTEAAPAADDATAAAPAPEPVKCALADVQAKIDEVIQSGKTPLILNQLDEASGEETSKIDTFYSYKGSIIEAKKFFVDEAVKKTHTLEQVLEDARKQLVACMKSGATTVIRMANGATDFKGKYNADDKFPLCVFEVANGRSKVATQDMYDKLATDDEKANPPGFDESNTKFQVVVTSSFALEDYEEFLKDSVPLEHMQVIQIEG